MITVIFRTGMMGTYTYKTDDTSRSVLSIIKENVKEDGVKRFLFGTLHYWNKRSRAYFNIPLKISDIPLCNIHPFDFEIFEYNLELFY